MKSKDVLKAIEKAQAIYAKIRPDPDTDGLYVEISRPAAVSLAERWIAEGRESWPAASVAKQNGKTLVVYLD